MATVIALPTTNDAMISHRQLVSVDMGLITELASTKIDEGCTGGNNGDDHESSSSSSNTLKNLLEHFYPESELDSPKFISLIGYKDEGEERGENLSEQCIWEKNPKNWINCPLTAFERLDAYTTSFSKLDKEQLGIVVPMAFKIIDSHHREHRIKGMQLVESFYRLGDVKFLLRANIHCILVENVLTSLTFNNCELIGAAYLFAMKILSYIGCNSGEGLYVCDSLVERSLFCLSHSSSTEERLSHWQGLHVIIEHMGVAFVRHFYKFFKTCEVVSFGVKAEAEVDCLRLIFETIEKMIPERYALRAEQINAIKHQCQLAFHEM